MDIRQVLNRLKNVRRNRQGWSARCPAHEDRRNSLSVTEASNGKVLIHCFAGCSPKSVFDALGISMKKGSSSGRKEVVAYSYSDERGNELYQTVRYEPKDFRSRRLNEKGEYEWNLNGVRRVLYRLPDIIAADKGTHVFIVEGEKDADNLREKDILATTCSGGAGKWREEYNASLVGHNVVIVPDNDDAGRRHAEQVAKSLSGVAKSVKVVELSGLPTKGDVSDWVKAGHTIEELHSLVAAVPEYNAHAMDAAPVTQSNDLPPNQPAFPELLPKALYGLAGLIVQTIAPHTEAHPAALLVQLFVAFGNCIGRSAYFTVEATRHYLVLFAVLVGLSSKGRKGTSWDHISNLFQAADEQWSRSCLQSGLSSGEGLIYFVRDPVIKQEPMKERGGRITGYQEVIVDEGVTDKRLLVMEAEFASALRVISREGNTLSPIIRRAWDKGDLRSLTKNSPLRATDAHISIIGHITKDELRRNLDEVETANGFANRFLWASVRRTRLLPEGGSLSAIQVNQLIVLLHQTIDFARSVGEMSRDGEANALWCRIYGELSSEDRTGLFGAVTSRSEAQVMRLACLYALLDLSDQIRRVHLEAALAFWRYCEDSARFIFGDSTGDKVADAVLEALREVGEVGLSKTDISNLFARNVNAARLNNALASLASSGRARVTLEHGDSGRPAQRWQVVLNPLMDGHEGNEINEIISGEAEASPNPQFNSLNSFLSSSNAGDVPFESRADTDSLLF